MQKNGEAPQELQLYVVGMLSGGNAEVLTVCSTTTSSSRLKYMYMAVGCCSRVGWWCITNYGFKCSLPVVPPNTNPLPNHNGDGGTCEASVQFKRQNTNYPNEEIPNLATLLLQREGIVIIGFSFISISSSSLIKI